MQPGIDLHCHLVLPRTAQQHLAATARRKRARLLAQLLSFIRESLVKCLGLLETTPLRHGAAAVFEVERDRAFSSPMSATSLAVMG